MGKKVRKTHSTVQNRIDMKVEWGLVSRSLQPQAEELDRNPSRSIFLTETGASYL